ncbi:hypothetical protein GSI_08798 [Ganoderma sinense ZZ0214-1]|uniref:Uncharacterized protein n=1 Tax=Ganoderma sinense ZZ0214-1 TaxID=1077348 RepID=A0A2G8S4U9_9APHY|nr:hypothetical protein GSI_08798 [Ganoderma sinense ZZ0214-1]
MRLINTETGRFEEFVNSSTAPHYAILSHTWEQPPKREQSYQDVVKIQEKFGLASLSDGEEVSLPFPNNKAASNVETNVHDESGTSVPTLFPLSEVELSHLSPSVFIFLKYVLLGILARASLYLLGSSTILPAEPRGEVEAPCPSSITRKSIWDPDSGLSEKIRKACEIARRDGYRYIWVDSSCIDKTSSSELSEAINSMFNWYRDAQICYAFLKDVPSNEDVRTKGRIPLRFPLVAFADDEEKERAMDSKFRRSRWFTRAWTLQELIAPPMVVFLSQDWEGLGTKHSLANLITEITNIDQDILTHKKALANETIAKRMRWAASREATRIEDEAYSLLGIFGITMPTLYGEGEHAFQRLQEAILQRIPDISLFAWDSLRLFHIS